MMHGMDDPNAVGGSSLDESFCMIDRDGAALPSAPPGNAGMPAAQVSFNAGQGFTPQNQGSPQMHQSPYPTTATQGQASTATPNSVSTPQRYDGYTQGPPQPLGQPPAGPPGPPQSAPSSGYRMTALRGKPHAELPSSLSMAAPASGYGGTAPYGQAPSADAARGSGYPSGQPGMPVSGSQQPPVQYGFDPPPPTGNAGGFNNPYGQQAHSQPGYNQSSSDGQESGLWGWVASTTNTVMESASRMVNQPDLLVEGAQRLGRNLVDKTKSSVGNVLTTLDPGMAQGGDGVSRQISNDLSTPGASLIQAKNIVLTTTKLPKIEAIKSGFQRCFQSVVVRGFVCPSGVAPQPFGLQACYNGAQQRIQYLRSMHGASLNDSVLIGIETCIAELIPGCFFDVACLVLHDQSHDIVLQALTQPIPLPAHYVESLRSSNPQNYAQGDSGFAVRWPTVLARELPGADPADPHRVMAGISRFRLLETAASSLARCYELQLQKWTSPLASSEPVRQNQPPPPQMAQGGMPTSGPPQSHSFPSSQHNPGAALGPPPSAGPGMSAPPPDARPAMHQSPYQQGAAPQY